MTQNMGWLEELIFSNGKLPGWKAKWLKSKPDLPTEGLLMVIPPSPPHIWFSGLALGGLRAPRCRCLSQCWAEAVGRGVAAVRICLSW